MKVLEEMESDEQLLNCQDTVEDYTKAWSKHIDRGVLYHVKLEVSTPACKVYVNNDYLQLHRCILFLNVEKTRRHHLNTKESRIPFLKTSSGEIISDDGKKASTLNNFFSECFNLSLPTLSEVGRTNFVNNTTSSSNGCPEELLCMEEEVLQMLLTLDTSKSSGPDGISAAMLKSTATSIAKGITALFNKSIKCGQLPKE